MEIAFTFLPVYTHPVYALIYLHLSVKLDSAWDYISIFSKVYLNNPIMMSGLALDIGIMLLYYLRYTKLHPRQGFPYQF